VNSRAEKKTMVDIIIDLLRGDDLQKDRNLSILNEYRISFLNLYVDNVVPVSVFNHYIHLERYI